MRRLALLVLLSAATLAAPLDAGGARPSGPLLSADPLVVEPGEAVVLRGHGFPRGARIALLAGPRQSEVERIGSAQTGRRGGFRASIQIREPSDGGRYVVLACHDRCRLMARAQFRVVSR